MLYNVFQPGKETCDSSLRAEEDEVTQSILTKPSDFGRVIQLFF